MSSVSRVMQLGSTPSQSRISVGSIKTHGHEVRLPHQLFTPLGPLAALGQAALEYMGIPQERRRGLTI